MKIITPLTAQIKAQNSCSYQERCQSEMRNKLMSWGMDREQTDNIIAQLISDGFIDEERFAKSFAGGKFRIKKWGRIKIKQGLRRLEISEYCIRIALKEIPDEDYESTLKILAGKKIKDLKAIRPPAVYYKAANYLLSKGFENDLVWNVLKQIENDRK